ncbi:tRNA (adenosine(37)-N6)-threonylcarbamoyltransferase complex ATPase subunit type 1 TsaE [Pseudanabaena mucicola]|uniref:tRNA threonylcarbamoyladenosine biosynthesis protein TsaE n=1 Tax=Pseudanabaena mucicola FACHB-723 TaxID=2692860 RepID=A0ABR7ZUX6_9CYAN|nr:tRNA (adenosine(37)-N6)-threonylcarbamoyltransferase complex ATPase subunit type 1 TsaE [Pseudanabaena mucicola]MBD2187713.1 tRNA (adenosine(37)-N6)-threonylcarbamoyltransferase complex ATPase subunit type 1 TsaE [Pseudanabaena mucicola FACHB-723]
MTETVKIDLYADNLGVTQAIATQLAQLVTTGTIILLEGNLGSGKTTFMQAFGLALGIQTTITSPTFTLIDEYTEGRLPLYHIDLYRLEPSQVPSLHIEEYWRGKDFPLGVVAIEWASKLIHLPPHYLQINLATPLPFDSSSKRNQVLEQDLDFDDDLLEALPEERTIQIIAKGEAAIEIIQNLKTSKN